MSQQLLVTSESTEAAARSAGQEAGEEASEKVSEKVSEEATANKKTWLHPTAEELATLLEAGLEPREGVPGLFLCRVEHNLLELRSGLTSLPIVPPDPIKLEGGQAQELADAM